MSYKNVIIRASRLKVNQSTDGETMEMKLERMLEGKEPITNGAPLIFQERKEGVNPAHDIRTDRFEAAIDATTTAAKMHQAKREALAKGKEKKDGKPEPTQGTTKTTPEK